MIEVIVIVVFAIVIWREIRKKDENPGYHSWTDDVKPWDQWRRHGKE